MRISVRKAKKYYNYTIVLNIFFCILFAMSYLFYKILKTTPTSLNQAIAYLFWKYLQISVTLRLVDETNFGVNAI